MTDAATPEDIDLIEITGEVIGAYVTNNSVSLPDLPRLIADVHRAFAALAQPTANEAAVSLVPAVPIKKSITPDFIICLDDGKKFKSLKRHLSQLGMTPDQYRAKWSLPASYPMVAANYSATRSALAKTIGLGRKTAPPKKPTRAKKS